MNFSIVEPISPIHFAYIFVTTSVSVNATMKHSGRIRKEKISSPVFFHFVRLFALGGVRLQTVPSARTVKSAYLHSTRSDKDGKWPAFACLFHFFNSAFFLSIYSPQRQFARACAQPHTRKIYEKKLISLFLSLVFSFALLFVARQKPLLEIVLYVSSTAALVHRISPSLSHALEYSFGVALYVGPFHFRLNSRRT